MTIGRAQLLSMSAAQKNKEVIFDENMARISALMAGVDSASTTAPPPTPGSDASFIVPAGATGIWAGHEGEWAFPIEGAGWRYIQPFAGPIVWVRDVGQFWCYTEGSPGSWGVFNPGAGIIGPGSSGAGNIPEFSGTDGDALQDSGKAFSTDGTMAANSANKVPVESAIVDYVKSQLDGRAWKNPVRLATTAALPVSTYDNGASGVGATITGDSNGALPSQDGEALAADDGLLVKDEASALRNGLYVVTQVGDAGSPFILTRRGDADTAAKLLNATVKVGEGADNGDKSFTGTADGPITVGVTALSFVVSSTGATYTADESTLHLSGTQFSMTADAVAVSTHAASGKTTPDDADTLPLVDSAASNGQKKVTWANIRATLKAYFDTIYAAIGAVTGSGLTMATGKLLGRSTASTGAIEEITVGSGLTLAGGTLSASGGGGGLSNFTEGVNTGSPNATVPVVSLTATNAASDVDVAIITKATGALLAQVPDGTSTAGNKRGSRAVDLQKTRSNAADVASGGYALILGGASNRATQFYSTVVGGQTNQATGQRTFIGGGESNTASGSYATVAGGEGNTASGSRATVPGGNNVAASGDYSFASGRNGTASGTYSVSMGLNCTADGYASWAMGDSANARGVRGVRAYAAGSFSAAGDNQQADYILRSDTTNATPEAITSDNSAAGTANQIVLPNASLYAFQGTLVVRENATGDSKAIKFEGAIKRGANASTTALVGTPTQADLGADAGASTWALAITADTTNGALKLEVTGEASHTLRWAAQVRTVQVVG